MRRLEILIDLAREFTQNTRYNETSGISQKVFVEYFNNASNSLNREITNAKSKWFLKEKLMDIVSGQEEYAWPSDIFLYNIDTLEYAANGIDFVDLTRGIMKDRFNRTVGYPYGYIPRNDGFLLAPRLNSGTLRINYIKQPSRLEKRSGKLSSVTQGSGIVTGMTIDPTESSFDPTYLNRDNYISIVDKFGVQTAKHVVFTSFNTTTGVITMDPFTLEDGDSIAVGSYVCAGYDSCNLPEYPTTAEDFLFLHVGYEVKYGDSSKWSQETRNDLVAKAQQIVNSFGIMTSDVVQVPIIEDSYLMIW